MYCGARHFGVTSMAEAISSPIKGRPLTVATATSCMHTWRCCPIYTHTLVAVVRYTHTVVIAGQVVPGESVEDGAMSFRGGVLLGRDFMATAAVWQRRRLVSNSLCVIIQIYKNMLRAVLACVVCVSTVYVNLHCLRTLSINIFPTERWKGKGGQNLPFRHAPFMRNYFS